MQHVRRCASHWHLHVALHQHLSRSLPDQNLEVRHTCSANWLCGAVCLSKQLRYMLPLHLTKLENLSLQAVTGSHIHNLSMGQSYSKQLRHACACRFGSGVWRTLWSSLCPEIIQCTPRCHSRCKCFRTTLTGLIIRSCSTCGA